MKRSGLLFAAMMLAISTNAQLSHPPRDAGGFKAPTAALERGRKVFVESSCHFCHGIDLTQAQMGAANLLDSPLVGADKDGNLIGGIAKAGLPNLQTSMPRYDLSPEQVKDLGAYVHYLRQQGRYERLMKASLSAGDASEGSKFAQDNQCQTCHTTSVMESFGKQDIAVLRSHLLLPNGTRVIEGKPLSPGAIAHRRMLENETPTDEANLIAYLKSLNR